MVGPLSPTEFEALAGGLVQRGWARLTGAFTADQAEAMRARMWEALDERHGVRRGDPSTWHLAQPTGLQDVREESVFAPIGGPRLSAALDGLLGAGRWRRPRHWGQFLASFPAEGWELPAEIWHTDYDFESLADDSVADGDPAPPFSWSGLQVFTCLSDAPERSGATLAVEGSHRVVGDFVSTLPEPERRPMRRVRRALMESDPWLRGLAGRGELAGSGAVRVEDFTVRGGTVSGRRVRVVELGGRAGDVVLAHPWLLHASSTNATGDPRFACVQRVRCDGPGHAPAG